MLRQISIISITPKYPDIVAVKSKRAPSTSLQHGCIPDSWNHIGRAIFVVTEHQHLLPSEAEPTITPVKPETNDSDTSAEEKSLKIVEDFVGELKHALDSLGSKMPTPNTLLTRYRFWSSKHLHRALAGFAFLRQSGQTDSSKFFVRPAIEMVIRLGAASKHPDLFYRIAFSEHRRDEQFLREVDKRLDNEAQSKQNWKRFEANWESFRDTFTKEFPDVPKEDKPLTVASAAEKMGMENLYGGHYRIYSQYTHGALLASIGYLDQGTDPEDNRIMAGCASTALDTLISLGAESTNRDDLFRRFQRLFAIQLKVEVVQAASGPSTGDPRALL